MNVFSWMEIVTTSESINNHKTSACDRYSNYKLFLGRKKAMFPLWLKVMHYCMHERRNAVYLGSSAMRVH